jgi:hypothetical protein
MYIGGHIGAPPSTQPFYWGPHPQFCKITRWGPPPSRPLTGGPTQHSNVYFGGPPNILHVGPHPPKQPFYWGAHPTCGLPPSPSLLACGGPTQHSSVYIGGPHPTFYIGGPTLQPVVLLWPHPTFYIGGAPPPPSRLWGPTRHSKLYLPSGNCLI